ncbi:Dimethyladenosine transferase 2, mitochondrial [Phytophthora boehmeriae]|uniref:rRNA adenine N(6)-methyltransferase n=1 Tax=Phytophthora boehmeriae TaxID=109152 RepID=A0A8T1WQJ3_9STRA|nr:Dimethyladenosine transferase 2, mitochondrial [Phytophthora boehmeriae]
MSRLVRASPLSLLHRRWASTSNVSRLHETPHLKRKLGQHLLVSDGILDQIVAAAELSAVDNGKDKLRVLEIGPGTGNLTSALLQIDAKIQVHAVEFDRRMVEQLQRRFATEIESGSLVLEHSDFEDFQFNSETDEDNNSFDACVANIPYQLSSLVVSRLSSYMHRFPTFQCAVLLVQEEFALRLLAQPGNKNYSRLSANTALVADVTSVVPVPRKHFLPPPKVDSRVIKMTPKVSALPADNLFFQKFDALLRLCFERKNKTLRALLLAKTARSQYLLLDDAVAEGEDKHQVVTERVEGALEACGLTSNRAVKISVTEFMRLMQELHDRGIDLRPSTTRHFKD